MNYDADAEVMKRLVRWYSIYKAERESDPTFADKYWAMFDGGVTVYAKMKGLDYAHVLDMVYDAAHKNPANI